MPLVLAEQQALKEELASLRAKRAALHNVLSPTRHVEEAYSSDEEGQLFSDKTMRAPGMVAKGVEGAAKGFLVDGVGGLLDEVKSLAELAHQAAKDPKDSARAIVSALSKTPGALAGAVESIPEVIADLPDMPSRLSNYLSTQFEEIRELPAEAMGRILGNIGFALVPIKGGQQVLRAVKGARGVKTVAKGVANLSKSQLKSIASFEKQIATHTQKLKAYKANPYKFDNKGFLKNAPNDAARQKIIQSRINHLNHEINTFQSNIQKILNGQ